MTMIALFLLSVVQATQPDLIGSELQHLGAASDLQRDITGVDGPGLGRVCGTRGRWRTQDVQRRFRFGARRGLYVAR